MSKEVYSVLKTDDFIGKYTFEHGERSPFEIGLPLFESSDAVIDEIYYYRAHTFSMHIKGTPAGHVVTEFLPKVPWSGAYNTINCPAGHHFREGRWFHDTDFLREYAEFWFKPEAAPRTYSFWAADAIYAFCETTGDFSIAEALYPALKDNYAEWDKSNLLANGLYYQEDGLDGMEFSAGGSGARPTINAYMYGDACALAKIALRLGLRDEADLYRNKADRLRRLVEEKLWDDNAQFYKTLAENKKYEALTDMRELVGYVPWAFNLPEPGRESAWEFLNSENHFSAPYGPTTAERCCPEFMQPFEHECLWNGPSWPFATSQTLTALGNLLTDYSQTVMDKHDYYALLHLFAKEHHLTEGGETRPFIDENLDPFTGEWLARKILLSRGDPIGGAHRGRHYNHSTYCDLVLSGIAGVRPRDDDVLEICPLFDADDLEYMCADGVLYHGHAVTVVWDGTGTKYPYGKGLTVIVDGAIRYCGAMKKTEIALS